MMLSENILMHDKYLKLENYEGYLTIFYHIYKLKLILRN